MKHIFLAGLLFAFSLTHAKDLGFRYSDGKCVNTAGTIGMNNGYIGQCGDLRGVVISRFNFESLDLSGSNFEGADLQGSSLRSTNLTGVSFVGGNLSGVDMESALIHSVNFTSAVMVNVHLSSADLKDVNFSKVDLSGALLSYMQFHDLKFIDAKLTGATMDSVDLSGANLSGAQLNEVVLQNSNLEGALCDNASFKAANLNATNFKASAGSNVVFTNAILRKANFENGSFPGANFRKAQLDGANLKGAKFVNSDFGTAVLKDVVTEGTVFTGAKFNKRTVMPFTPAEAAAKFGMILDNRGDSFAEQGGHYYYKIEIKGQMSDANVLAGCVGEGLAVPCVDKVDGPYSDTKCMDVGWRDGDSGSPMDTISKMICAGKRPNTCPLLNHVFQYMGGKFVAGSSCGTVDGNWCATGNQEMNQLALCVE